MSQRSLISKAALFLAAMVTGLPMLAHAGEVPYPTIIEPDQHFSADQECVLPEDEMRRNHMELILHQRDKTVHNGVRTREHSFEECINCHAIKGDDGEYLRVESPKHFCASCHNYAAVKIDCFQCHADVPVRPSKQHNQRSQLKHHDTLRTEKNLSSQTLKLLSTKGKL